MRGKTRRMGGGCVRACVATDTQLGAEGSHLGLEFSHLGSALTEYNPGKGGGRGMPPEIVKSRWSSSLSRRGFLLSLRVLPD